MRGTTAAGAVFAAALALLSSACVRTVADQMRSWEGRHVDELMESWGVPDEVGRLSDGERVMTWVSASGLYVLHFTCRKTFLLAEDDSVARWSYRGCPPITLHLSQQAEPPRRAVGANGR